MQPTGMFAEQTVPATEEQSTMTVSLPQTHRVRTSPAQDHAPCSHSAEAEAEGVGAEDVISMGEETAAEVVVGAEEMEDSPTAVVVASTGGSAVVVGASE